MLIKANPISLSDISKDDMQTIHVDPIYHNCPNANYC